MNDEGALREALAKLQWGHDLGRCPNCMARQFDPHQADCYVGVALSGDSGKVKEAQDAVQGSGRRDVDLRAAEAERLAAAIKDRDMLWWEKCCLVDSVAPTPEEVGNWIAKHQAHEIGKAVADLGDKACVDKGEAMTKEAAAILVKMERISLVREVLRVWEDMKPLPEVFDRWLRAKIEEEAKR